MNPLEADFRLVTCVTPKGVGLPLLRRLSVELEIESASLQSARGMSGSDPTAVFNRVEKDVITVVVPAKQSEEVFLWMYWAAEVSTQRGRFMHMAPLQGATPYRLPEGVPQEHD